MIHEEILDKTEYDKIRIALPIHRLERTGPTAQTKKLKCKYHFKHVTSKCWGGGVTVYRI